MLRRLAALGLLFLLILTGQARASEVLSNPPDVPVHLPQLRVSLPPAPGDFKVETREGIKWAFPASVEERVAGLFLQTSEMRRELSQLFGVPVLSQLEVRVARDPEQMAELAPLEIPPPAYATGVAYPSLRLVLLSLKVPETWQAPNLEEVYRHELAHIAMREGASGHHVPRWFDEGFAVHVSGESPVARTRTLWEATVQNRLLPLIELDDRFPNDPFQVNVAYAEAADFVRFLFRGTDAQRFSATFARVRGGEPFDRALGEAYASDRRKLEYEWREELGKKYNIWPLLLGSGTLWSVFALLLVVSYVRKRRAAAAKLRAWDEEEHRATRLAREREAREAREWPARPPGEVDVQLVPPASIPVIEHEGRIFTVH